MGTQKSGPVTLRPEVQAAIEAIVDQAVGRSIAAATPDSTPTPAPATSLVPAPVNRLVLASMEQRTVTQDGELVADMEQMSFAKNVESLNKIGGLGVVGSIVFGAIPGAVVGEVIDGLVPVRTAGGEINLVNVLVKGAAAWGGVKYGRKIVGAHAAGFFAGAIGLQVAAELLPLDRWVDALVGKLGGLRIPGLAGASNYGAPARQAQQDNTILSPATGRYASATSH